MGRTAQFFTRHTRSAPLAVAACRRSKPAEFRPPRTAQVINFREHHGGPAISFRNRYGQLLRRMTDPTPATRYAAIVPTSALRHAQRVSVVVRALGRIDPYEVTDDDTVTLITS